MQTSRPVRRAQTMVSPFTLRKQRRTIGGPSRDQSVTSPGYTEALSVRRPLSELVRVESDVVIVPRRSSGGTLLHLIGPT